MGYLFIFFSLVCFVLLCQSFSSYFVHHLCSPSEASALLQFNQFFEIAPSGRCYKASFPKTISWNESTNCCTWEGVTCDMLTGYVIGLDLSCSFLHGTIHRNSSLFQLYHLQSLNLAHNDFNWSSFPNDIGRLRNLKYLNLRECDFSGSIPDSIGNLTQMRQLDFGDNHFTGHIPSTISNLKQLILLDLWSNSLGGEIPDIFSNFQVLADLVLSNNRFTGSFPPSILSLTRLQRLDLSSNSLSGPLPSSTSMLQKLSDLNLSNNSLNGTVPSWVFSIPLVYPLKLHHNQLSGVADELKMNPTLKDLDLSHNQLSGPVPPSLANLINLATLDLSSNNITDDLGIEFFSTMQRLDYIDLSYNHISWRKSIKGSKLTLPYLEVLLFSSCELKDFPHFLRGIKTIRVLDLSNNKIHGTIPKWFSNMKWDSLSHLNISHNSLTGHLEQLHFYNLNSLDLKFNFLQGPLPSSICKMSSLSFLDLSHNYFTDSVPHCLGNMDSLFVLDLRSNSFSGSLPTLCSRTTSHLRTIVLYGNNSINGTFPTWLGTLQQLQVLILKSNKFHGPISACQTEFCFPMLRILDVSRNEFNGSLLPQVFRNFRAMIKLDDTNKGTIKYMEPDLDVNIRYIDSVKLVIKGQDIDLERITTIMTVIDLSSNHFDGVIPKALKDLSSLWLLNLSHNDLRGDIPTELGQMNTLEALDLSWNWLTGTIPRELTRLKFLAVFNLSQNVLVGPIPQGSQFNTFSNDSYGGNLDLCGPPLSKKCGMSDPSHVPQPLESEEEDDESYFASGFTWESVVIGYSCGLVVGTVMFKSGKPKWFLEGIIPHKNRRRNKRGLR
ncbi:hypothetical protein EJD97_025270 [Solanum chilense]|uniref:Uncharacterized protein n=1 Tax=Solanum chilense TaxID=4083 RepID=A0A6N2C817_SOLCI|nr:hypothetical protein EJD97_025270 [Solanum chilense]